MEAKFIKSKEMGTLQRIRIKTEDDECQILYEVMYWRTSRSVMKVEHRCKWRQRSVKSRMSEGQKAILVKECMMSLHY